MILPSLGNASYYRASQPITVGAIAIPINSLYALANISPDKFLLITSKQQINITPSKAKEISEMGTFTKNELVEDLKKRTKAKAKGLLERLLFEAESAVASSETDPVVLQDVSLDQKVDKYLVRYEREAIPTSNDYGVEVQSQIQQKGAGQGPQGGFLPVIESKGLLANLLFEAPGDPMEDPMADPMAAPAADPMADPMADPAAASAPAAPATPPVVDTPKMNMNSYTRAVARLINNYEALLNPRTTILNRAKEYIRVNYDEATATLFEETMSQQYDITPEVERRDASDAPHAGNAQYGGGGAGG